MPSKISIRIDGELVHAQVGQTILDVAADCGKNIPSLCSMKGLKAVGACRLCLVEVDGVGRLLPACTTPVQDGMSVTTENNRLRSYRQMIIELLLAERNHICAVCVSNGHCELQTAAATLGVTHTRYAYRFPHHKVDLSHPRYTLDQNRCILCTRCVRVCADVEGAHVWEIGGRGIGSQTGLRAEPQHGANRVIAPLRQMRPKLPHRRARREGLRRGRDDQAARTR